MDSEDLPSWDWASPGPLRADIGDVEWWGRLILWEGFSLAFKEPQRTKEVDTRGISVEDVFVLWIKVVSAGDLS